MSTTPSGQPAPNKGVALTNWMVRRASGFLERRSSRRGFLVGSAVAGSAVAVAGVDLATKPMSAYAAITDCGPGSACADGYTEFCCGVTGLNACPPGSFAGGWWRADYSSFCNGTRYYIDCMQDCCGPGVGNNFCAGCTECRCANGCNTRRVYCNYFRYGQCHQEIAFSGPIACRVVTCVPPYTVAEWACSTAAAVDNATAEHAGNCLPPPVVLPPPRAILPAFGASVVSAPGAGTIFVRAPNGGVGLRSWNGTTWGSWDSFGPTMNSGLTAVVDTTGTYMFGRGVDLALWYKRLVGSTWSAWSSLGGVVTSDPSAVVDPAGFYVFVRGSDNAVWYFRLSSTGGSGWVSLGPTAQSEPVAVSDPSGLYVFVTGTDAGVWYRRLSGSSWSPWISLGPTATSTVSAVSDPSGVHVFIRGRDNAVWYRRLVGSSWTAWASLGGIATGDPVTVSDPSGLYVFVRGTDNGIWYRRSNGGVWAGTGWTSLGPTIVSDPMAVSDGTAMYVFGQGLDNAVWYQRFAAGTWSGWLTLGGAMAPTRA